jgi:hypothetical protein
LTCRVAEAIPDCPWGSLTVSDTVEDPLCPLTGASVAVQVNDSVPQPALMMMAELGNIGSLLLLAATVREPDPLRVKAIGEGEFGNVTD